MHAAKLFLLALLLASAQARPAFSQNWSTQPWLEDLAQMRQALERDYANRDWLEHERKLALAPFFERAEGDVKESHSDDEAKRVFERVIQRVNDGHLAILWPQEVSSSPANDPSRASPPDLCESIGFRPSADSAGVAASLPFYRALDPSGPFATGMITNGRTKLGILRIGSFDALGSKAICAAALQSLDRTESGDCNDPCQDQILERAYALITRSLEDRLRALRAAGAQILLVDITDNGGGSQWVEAAARIISPKKLTSERRGFVRGAHWSHQWADLTQQLRDAARSAEAQDRQRLLHWAQAAQQAQAEADRPCAATEDCPVIAHGGYSTGLVGRAAAGDFAGKPWAPLVFSPAQYPYHESVWRGPLLVLVDNETWSAAEEFAALLQDNGAAVIIGSRTGGAGCGHTNGGTPRILANSHATLELPDCVRFRADGTNEVAGVIPDIATEMRASDGAPFEAGLLQRHLAQAIEVASAKQSRR